MMVSVSRIMVIHTYVAVVCSITVKLVCKWNSTVAKQPHQLLIDSVELWNGWPASSSVNLHLQSRCRLLGLLLQIFESL